MSASEEASWLSASEEASWLSASEEASWRICGTRIHRALGIAFIDGYVTGGRLWRKLFSVMASGGFARFGSRSVLCPPIRLEGHTRVAIGSDVFVGPGSWLHVEGGGTSVAIEIGDGTSIGSYSALSAVHSLKIGRRVLTARGIYVADHRHAFGDATLAVKDQGLAAVGPVEIADGAWLGENVVVCPGVRIGRGAVIGANSVVTADVPDGALAVGAPARIVRSPAPAKR